MSLPILQPSSTNIPPQIRGDVTIDSSVIVASGVILNATPGNKITIYAGVCLGMGTIITAHEGDVEIQANAILGPGTLILGNCVIGSQASLGTSVTVYHAKVKKLALIPAGSIIGDYSRQVEVSEQKAVVIDKTQEEIAIAQTQTYQSTEVKEEILTEEENQVEYSQDSIIDKINRFNQNSYSRKKNPSTTTQQTDNLSAKKAQVNQSSAYQVNQQEEKEVNQSSESISEQEVEKTKTSVEPKSSSQTIAKNKEVIGKVYINRMLYTLFPDKNR